jgi:serine/threonine-protein kinase
MKRCPTREQLTRLLNEALSDEEHPAIEGHVERCGRCQEALEELTRLAKVVPGPRFAPTADEKAFVAGLVRQLAPDRLRPAADTAPAGPDVTPGGPGGGAPAWPEVPGYEILGVLGRGGMAVVYKGRHLRLGRLVALKILAGRGLDDPGQRTRFRTEATAVARLQHPNIVQIYEVGEAEGRPYLALEYLAGGSLRERVNGTPQRPDAAARLVETLARAIHAAHQAGIVHRDLKPANILLAVVSGQWSVVSDNKQAPASLRTTDHWSLTTVPKITDFGLAKHLDPPGPDTAAGPATASGEVLGSPGYLAPEQATPSSHGGTSALRIGPAADVFALGAILYELLTGRPPFRGATAVETVLQTVTLDPVPPRRLSPGAPRDLETICLKCLRKEPGGRYARAADLAEDLGRFLRGEPIRARPVGLAGRLWRWGQRQPRLAALTAALVALLLLGAAGAVRWAGERAQRQAEAARHVQEQAMRQAATAGAVDQALDEARRLMSQYQWPEAAAAAQRARALLANGEGTADLERRVQQYVADTSLILRLLHSRVREGPVAQTPLDDAIREAFRDYGIDLTELDPDTAAARIRASALRTQLTIALDYWAWELPERDQAFRERLWATAARAEPDEWRNRLRAALARADRAALDELAREPQALEQPPVLILLMIDALDRIGAKPSAESLLRRGQQRHPTFFWINYRLGLLLLHGEPPRPDEAVGFFRAALISRPTFAGVHLHLGRALLACDPAQAEVAFRQALKLEPDYAEAHFSLGVALAHQGSCAEAQAAHHQAIRLRANYRFRAACEAASLGGGPTAALSEAQRGRWRQQALSWLREELTFLAGQGNQRPAAVEEKLRRWWQAPQLAGVRDDAALGRFPAEEREAWRQLWAEAEALSRGSWR